MTTTTPVHLNPQADFHPHVLVPGDPARAMAIATAQLEEPRMFNHRRGLWGYSGKTPRGTGFVVQSTGMGGPSAAIVCEELCDLGATTLLRVGTCGAISPDVKNGDLIVVTAAIRGDGTSRALCEDTGSLSEPGEPALPDRELTELLLEAATASGHQTHACTVATVDLFYDVRSAERERQMAATGAKALEMEAATVLTVAEHRGIRGACLLAVTDEIYDGGHARERVTHDEITALGELMGRLGVQAVEALVGS